MKIATSVVPPPISISTTPSSFSSGVSTASADAIGCRIRSDTSRPQRRTHLTMFCTADTAPVTICTFTSSRMPLMPIGSRTSSWLSTMNSCGTVCSNLLVGRDVDRLRGFDHARDIGRGDFLVLDGDHAARIEAADMAAGDAGIDVADLAVGHQLGFFQRALDRFDSRLDIDDHALFQALAIRAAQGRSLHAVRSASPRPPPPPPSRCRCRGRRSGFSRLLSCSFRLFFFCFRCRTVSARRLQRQAIRITHVHAFDPVLQPCHQLRINTAPAALPLSFRVSLLCSLPSSTVMPLPA